MPIQLDLTDDQALFHETTARFIETELPRERTRALHDDPAGFDRGWLTKAAELGWFSMLVPEELGGGSVSDNGLADAALIAEELGRQVQPGPFIPMNVALAAVAAHGADRPKAELLPAGVAGQAVVTWAFADERGGWDRGAGVTLAATGGGFAVSGVRGHVQDAGQADWLLVAGTLDGEAVQVLVPTGAAGLVREPLTCLDLSRRMATVRLDGVEVPGDALVGGGTAALDHQLRQAAVLAAVETVGAMDTLFTMTVEYSKDRIAFGRPIGSFQALKHVMADLALELETSKAAVTAAIEALGRGADAAAEVVSMAAAYVGEQGNELAQQCLQIHGGIGYTWEHDLHLLMRRVQTNSVLYGSPTWHREQVCAFHGLGTGAAR
ncbi:MAG: acyl-CoA/acyl-ACP dehydrogenase [Acidimicrobiia bacterium]|nr:acyl-CoA/acyl-ACP dehydrogenase [Acidimicrobiia bacterium]